MPTPSNFVMPEELIILTDEDFEPDECSRGGWNEPLKRTIGKLQEVKLDPAQVEARMSEFIIDRTKIQSSQQAMRSRSVP